MLNLVAEQALIETQTNFDTRSNALPKPFRPRIFWSLAFRNGIALLVSLVSSNDLMTPLRPSVDDGDSPSTARAAQAKPADHEGQAAT